MAAAIAIENGARDDWQVIKVKYKIQEKIFYNYFNFFSSWNHKIDNKHASVSRILDRSTCKGKPIGKKLTEKDDVVKFLQKTTTDIQVSVNKLWRTSN